MNKLNETITFKRGLKLKNPIVMAPMTTKMSFYDGIVTQDELNYYSLRTGEVGAVITAAANVQEVGKGWEGELSVASDEMIPSLSRLASTIKRDGTKAILQIFHGGRMTNSKILRGEQPVAPSAVAAEREGAETPRELMEAEIPLLIEDYRQAAIRAIKAGFDGVELHGANTYLIQQFFSPHSNRRSDQWGGSVEKRAHFIDLLVDRVTSAVDEFAEKEFIVGYRFSPEEYEEPGIKMADTMYLVDLLANKPLDYLHISLNDYQRISVSKEFQEKSMLAYVHEKIAGRLPLIGVGDVRTGKQAGEVLENAELVAVGRALLIDPHWTKKVLEGKEATIRTTLPFENRDELIIQNGVWGFLQGMMPDRLV
ncbi:NADH-dependent flavin oxidoreductase [Enterococcus sp. BWM-S5]|uniref:NADH-dependent flavin oxidoreductase n=1 Tax=Enterococcus larvae TaxID=2794352 RepID=A0ABS4CHI8_9ENTE|nr:NADH-dependent flavin oxidoreductase [Enterococcus larvae]MBP1046026.1 NADH-dependent flavin oxidoreductase [Enterococcus larvae]